MAQRRNLIGQGDQRQGNLQNGVRNLQKHGRRRGTGGDGTSYCNPVKKRGGGMNWLKNDRNAWLVTCSAIAIIIYTVFMA